MAVWQVFKVSRKTFFDPSGWFNYDSFKENTQSLWGIISGLFVSENPEREESFEEAMTRLGLTEEDLAKTAKNYYLYAMIFLVFGALTFFFSFYLLFAYHTFSGWILGIASSALFLVQAFRFHFWYFQIKHRKLGCTLQEWRSGKINQGNTP